MADQPPQAGEWVLVPRAIVQKIADIQADIADFDGDRRGHYAALDAAEEELTVAAIKALAAAPAASPSAARIQRGRQVSKLTRVGSSMDKTVNTLRKTVQSDRKNRSSGSLIKVDYFALCNLIDYYEDTKEAAERWIKIRELIDGTMFQFNIASTK